MSAESEYFTSEIGGSRLFSADNMRRRTCSVALVRRATRPERARVPRAYRSAFAMASSRTSGHLAVAAGFDPREVSAATRERRARACSSPSSMLSTAFAILAMARVVDAAVVPEWPDDLTSKPEPWSDPAGVSAQHAGIVEPFLVENVYDNDIAGGKSFLQNRDTWSMYYSGVAKGPWVQLDLGAEKTISAIEIYGHRAEPRCDLNLLGGFPAGCDGSVEQLGEDYYPTFSDQEYASNNNGGAVIGVGQPGETGPCVDGQGGSGGDCGGVVCATLSTMTHVGFANLGEDGIEKLPDASIKVIWYASPFPRRASLTGHVHSQAVD